MHDLPDYVYFNWTAFTWPKALVAPPAMDRCNEDAVDLWQEKLAADVVVPGLPPASWRCVRPRSEVFMRDSARRRPTSSHSEGNSSRSTAS